MIIAHAKGHITAVTKCCGKEGPDTDDGRLQRFVLFCFVFKPSNLNTSFQNKSNPREG